MNMLCVAPLMIAFKPSTMFPMQCWLFPLVMHLSDYATGMSLLLGTFHSQSFDKSKRGELALTAIVKNMLIFAIIANFQVETRTMEGILPILVNWLYQLLTPIAVALIVSVMTNKLIQAPKAAASALMMQEMEHF